MSQRDVIWITLESVRYDRTTVGGHSRETTPRLQSLSERSDSLSFNSCFSHDIWTRSSTASILTGRAPSDHRTWASDAKLPDEIRTIPEHFSAAGYRTVGISPNPQFSSATGLDRGFDDFHYLTRQTLFDELRLVDLAKYLLNIRRHSAGFTTNTKAHTTGYLSNTLAKRHIREAGKTDTPLFLYTHLGDTHHAYYPPIAWQSRFSNEIPSSIDDALSFVLSFSNDLHAHIAYGVPFTEEEWETIRVMYDSTLAYVDSLIGELVEYVRTHLDDPIIVVTADHGELFGEEGLLAHMLVANTAVSHVPLVVSGLNLNNELRNQLVQPADVMAMLFEDLDVDFSVPAGQDIRSDPRSFAVTQRSGKRARQKQELILERNPDFNGSEFYSEDLTSIRDHHFRYQRSGADSDLFELPDETTDISSERQDLVDEWDARLSDWLSTHSRIQKEDNVAEFNADMQQQLRDLGYL